MIASCLIINSQAFALSNEDRIQMLDDKFIQGEITEETYKRLLKKYRGKTDEEKPPQAEAKPVKRVDDNLVKNFSFEEQTADGFPEGWNIKRKGSKRVDITVSTEESHTGTNSIQFYSYSHAHWGEMVIQRIHLKPGAKHKVIFWAKGKNLKRGPESDGMPCVVSVEYKGEDGKMKPVYIEPKIGNKWKMVTKVITVPSDAPAEGRIRLMLYCASGTLWIDDVVVAPLQ